MTQADRVHSTPPTNAPMDPARRRFLTVAAVGSMVSTGALAAAALTPGDVPQAVTLPTAGPAGLPASAEAAGDPAFALIAEKRAADDRHGAAIDQQDEAEDRFGLRSAEAIQAEEDCGVMCRAVNEIDWRLATTAPTTLAGVAAVLRFANQLRIRGRNGPTRTRLAARAGTTGCGPPWRPRLKPSWCGHEQRRQILL